MHRTRFLAALAAAFSLPATAQLVVLPVLTPGGPIAGVTTQVFSALPAPLGTTAPLPVDATALENGRDGSGVNQVLGLGSNQITSTIIGQQLNNTLGTPLLGLPRGTAQPVDIAVLGGNGVGNSNAAGVAGIAALSGNNVANGGLVGLGVLNGDRSGSGRLLGVAALSGRSSGRSSEGLGLSVLNRGESAGVYAQGAQVITLGSVASRAQGALPGLDNSGLAIGGGKTVGSSNPLLNVGVLAGDRAGSGGMVGVAALSGNDAANAQLIGIGLLNGNGIGAAVLSGANSGLGGGLGAGVLTGDGSGKGGTVGVGALSGASSGSGGTAGVGALSGGGSGTGGMAGGNVAGSSSSAGGGDGGNGGGSGGTGDNGTGNGTRTPSTTSAGGAYAYVGDAGNGRAAARGDACKTGYRDSKGRMVRPEQCATQGKSATVKG